MVVGIVPARGGSRGLPGKHLRLVAGRPLIDWTFEAARSSRRLDRVVLSTDDEAIAAHARTLGVDVPFLRPAALAADETPMVDVLRHAVAELTAQGAPPDVVVLLQPTSPLRTAAHIDAALDLLERSGADAVVSVVEVPHRFNPVSVLRIEADRVAPWLDGPAVTRRQDKPHVVARNGPAVLAVRAHVVAEGRLYGPDTRALPMRDEDSIDVDTAWELAVAELALLRRSAGRG